jgi:succinylarginine dihydrolase
MRTAARTRRALAIASPMRAAAAATKARAGDACGGAEKFVPKKNLQNG